MSSQKDPKHVKIPVLALRRRVICEDPVKSPETNQGPQLTASKRMGPLLYSLIGLNLARNLNGLGNS